MSEPVLRDYFCLVPDFPGKVDFSILFPVSLDSSFDSRTSLLPFKTLEYPP